MLLAPLLLSSCHSTPATNLDYAPKIAISNLRMSSAENFAKQTIYYMDATVKNNGNRTVTSLDAQAQFRNLDNQVIFKDTAGIITERRLPLAPGESRDYRVGFEGIPDGWNQRPPDLTITRIELK